MKFRKFMGLILFTGATINYFIDSFMYAYGLGSHGIRVGAVVLLYLLAYYMWDVKEE